MPTEDEARLQTYHGWTFRFRPGRLAAGQLLVMLHGWKGDENSMGIFTRQLPGEVTLLAPRAPFSDPQGGYTWREFTSGNWGYPSLEQLRPALGGLLAFLDSWSASIFGKLARFDLLGFSQGAAMSYTLALLNPGRVGALASLSGFLPDGAEQLLAGRPLAGKPVFVSHGRQDNLVPVERARRSVALLEAGGSRVTYCESDAGHKVSPDCLKGMESFFGSIYNHRMHANKA